MGCVVMCKDAMRSYSLYERFQFSPIADEDGFRIYEETLPTIVQARIFE
jgi:hypothetical protein